MKILMLVNWKVKKCDEKPDYLQPPDFYLKCEDYWFFRYFKNKPEVDVVDVSSFQLLEKFEKNKLRFYVWQTIKILPKLNQYDLIISHGMQSGVVLSLWRRIFKTKTKHIVFDIGAFNSASESGFALKLMQFASKSIDYIIYHTSSQKVYYEKHFRWLVEKSEFVRFGTDLDFYSPNGIKETIDKNKYIVCVGYSKRDWDTLVKAYQKINTDIRLRLIGHVEEKYKEIDGIEQVAFIPVKELIKQIRNALFCVLPLESFNYSYGQMTLMQQMALEKCVITAKVPSLVDYIEDGKTAILYEPKSVDELAQRMIDIMHNENKRNITGIKARMYLLERCNEEVMAQEIERVFNKIVNIEERCNV